MSDATIYVVYQRAQGVPPLTEDKAMHMAVEAVRGVRVRREQPSSAGPSRDSRVRRRVVDVNVLVSAALTLRWIDYDGERLSPGWFLDFQKSGRLWA